MSAAGLALTFFTFSSAAQYGTQGGEWPNYAGDSGSTRYSPLAQINKDNVDRLELAWRPDPVTQGQVFVFKKQRPLGLILQRTTSGRAFRTPWTIQVVGDDTLDRT